VAAAQGVSMGAYGLLAQALVGWLVSYAVTPLCRRFTPKWVWVCSQGVFAVAMLCTLFVPSGQVAGGIAIFAVLGAAWLVCVRRV
jgi:Na+/melibiose symporter-like transporter